jgi:hypothetical protein
MAKTRFQGSKLQKSGTLKHLGDTRLRPPKPPVSPQGESIDAFLARFPSVKREQVIAVIEAGKLTVLEAVNRASP